MENLNLNQLDFERNIIFKRLKILKILAFIEGLIVLFLAFVFSKEIIIALFLGVLVGVLFYRLLSKKLLARNNAIESEIFHFFLKENKAKLTEKKLERDFLDELNIDFTVFKAKNGIEFDDFTFYEAYFENSNGKFFLGLLIRAKNAKIQGSISEDGLFERLKNKDFNTDKVFAKGELALVAALQNPFFLKKNLNLNENLKNMSKNLEKIRKLIRPTEVGEAS